MRTHLLCLLCFLTLDLAAEIVAETAAVAHYADGAVIRSGETVTTPRQITLTLPGTVHSEVILAAGSQATFTAQENHLRIALETGTIQIDVEGLGPWQGLTVQGGSSEVSVTGTLFVVARDRRGVDTVALVRGAVQLRLRREIVAALGMDPTVDLTDRQQVSAGPDGFTAVTTLSLPLLLSESATTSMDETEIVAIAILDGLLDDAVGKAAEADDNIIDTIGGFIGLPPSPP